MKLSFDVTARFFDRAVLDGLSKAARKVLSKFGAFVRRDARSSIKPAKGPHDVSQPGRPPKAHGRRSPIRLILFAYDRAEQSVTIGPVAFGPNPGEAPETLEYGGHGRLIEVLARAPKRVLGRDARGRFEAQIAWEEQWLPAFLVPRRLRTGKPTRRRRTRIEQRPFMTPAFQRTLPHLREWRASL